MKFPVIITVFLFILAFPGFSLDIETTASLEIQASTLPEAKLGFTYAFILPLFQGTGPLTEENNLEIALTAEVSPLSLGAITEITLTPIAFLQFHGGAMLASGWNIDNLGYGLGIRRPIGSTPGSVSSPREVEVSGSAFEGLVWQAFAAGTFQFDLAALFPGDWNHLVFQSRQEFRYSHYTEAGKNDFWIFENDDGENRNGWTYHSGYTLGYMMPQSPILNFAGLMAEYKRPLYSNLGTFWGEDLGKWIFSSVLNFAITPNLSTILALQVLSRRNHGLTDFMDNSYYLQDLQLQNDGGNRRFLFYRAALVTTYTF